MATMFLEGMVRPLLGCHIAIDSVATLLSWLGEQQTGCWRLQWSMVSLRSVANGIHHGSGYICFCRKDSQTRRHGSSRISMRFETKASSRTGYLSPMHDGGSHAFVYTSRYGNQRSDQSHQRLYHHTKQNSAWTTDCRYKLLSI